MGYHNGLSGLICRALRQPLSYKETSLFRNWWEKNMYPKIRQNILHPTGDPGFCYISDYFQWFQHYTARHIDWYSSANSGSCVTATVCHSLPQWEISNMYPIYIIVGRKEMAMIVHGNCRPKSLAISYYAPHYIIIMLWKPLCNINVLAF